jgi:IS30 family transposase
VAIDRATRLIYIEIHDDKKACTTATFLKRAIEFFPFEIQKILTDNGKEFTLKNHLGKIDLE